MAASPNDPQVGKDILAFCTRCKMDLTHTIIAMQGDRVVKVSCNTCKSPRTYRPAKGAKAPIQSARASRTAGGGSRKQVMSTEDAWAERDGQLRSKPARPYSVRTAFRADDRVQHPTFGEGFVERLIHPNKMEVLFQNGMKVLIHGGPENP